MSKYEMEGEYPEEEEPEIRLRDGIDLKELRDGGTSFEISDIDPCAPVNTYFPDEAYKVFSEDMGDNDPGSASDTNSAGSDHESGEAFGNIVKQMTDVLGDGGVKKVILKPGAGPVIPEKSLATVHYNGYLEYGDEPFDSTRARGKPLSFYLGSGEVVEALDIAVATMKRGEQAKFLFQPEYFLGERGCPPRIPANAPCLFVVELMTFVECSGVDEFYRMSIHDKREADFALVKKVVQKERESGKDHFGSRNYYRAMKSFKRAIKYLEEFHLKNEEEENEQKKILLPLYQNVSLCHLKLAHCGSAIAYANQALAIDRTAKAYYYKGQALRKQSDFANARTCLKNAQRLAPHDADISRELKNLDSDVERFKAAEVEFCKKLFAVSNAKNEEIKENRSKYVSPTAEVEECSEQFRDLIKERLLEIKNDTSITEFNFPIQNLSEGEIQCLKSEAESLGMTSSERKTGNTLEAILRKPNPHQ